MAKKSYQHADFLKTKKMRTISLIFALLLVITCKAQVTNTSSCDTIKKQNEEVIHKVVEKMPEFPGGMNALNQFIKENLRYPEEAVKKKIQGTVVVQFAVMKDGSVDKVSVYVKAHPELDDEAVRVIKLLPKWKPGKINGKEVNSYYIIPVVFTLERQKK